MYVRITFAIAFVFFVCGWFSLKIQARKKPLIFDDYEKQALALNHKPVEKIEIPNDKLETIYEAAKSQQHGFHVLPSSFWPFLTAYLTFDILFFVVRYLHYGLTCYTLHHLIVSTQYLLFVLFC